MTREQVRDVLPILQAYADGKAIQYRCDGKYSDIKTILLGELEINSARYRIKPEPKYRPFKDAEEYWKEMKNHQPFGYIIDKTTKLFSNIGMLDNRGILTICTQYSCSLKESFNRYTFADGTPFGIKEGTDD